MIEGNRYPVTSTIEDSYGAGSDDEEAEEKPLPYPNDVNAIVNAVGRVTAVVNPPHIIGTQSRHFSLRTSCYDPEAEKKSREFTVQCICPNTKRWEIARNVIPAVGALVHISGQLIGTFENDRELLPAVELLEILRLLSNTTTAAASGGLPTSSGTAATLSPTTNRVMKNLHARAGKKGKGASGTTPLPIPYPLTAASSGSQPRKARATLSSVSQRGPDAQLGSGAQDELGGDAAVPMLISDDSSSTSTVTNHAADDVRQDNDGDGDSDTSFVSLSRFRE